MTAHDAALVAGLAGLLAAAGHDMLVRTIPDRATVLVALAGLVLSLADGVLLQALPVAVLLFAAGFAAWRFGLVGGGDVKLLAASALMLPPGTIGAALVLIAGSGTVVALPYLAARGRVPVRPAAGRAWPILRRFWCVELFRLRRGGPVPYGLAITAGVVLTLWGPGG